MRCFPRKYGRSSARSADDTETCTIFSTPARLAASNSAERALDRFVERMAVALEANPVRVVEHRRAAQALDERVVEASGATSIRRRSGSVGSSRRESERTASPRDRSLLGDRASGVGHRPGDRAQRRGRRSSPSPASARCNPGRRSDAIVRAGPGPDLQRHRAQPQPARRRDAARFPSRGTQRRRRSGRRPSPPWRARACRTGDQHALARRGDQCVGALEQHDRAEP